MYPYFHNHGRDSNKIARTPRIISFIKNCSRRIAKIFNEKDVPNTDILIWKVYAPEEIKIEESSWNENNLKGSNDKESFDLYKLTNYITCINIFSWTPEEDILIIDDTPKNLEAANKIFRGSDTASWPLEAIEKIESRTTPYGFIITDMNMWWDSESGKTILEKAREIWIPIIVFSGWWWPGHIIKEELSMDVFDMLGDEIHTKSGWDFATKASPESWECLRRCMCRIQVHFHDGKVQEELRSRERGIIFVPCGLPEKDTHNSLKKIIDIDIRKIVNRYELEAWERFNRESAEELGISLAQFLARKWPSIHDYRSPQEYERACRLFTPAMRGITLSTEEKKYAQKHHGPQEPMFLWKCWEYELFEQIDRCSSAYWDRCYGYMYIKKWKVQIPLISRAWHVIWGTGFEVIEFKPSLTGIDLKIRNKHDDEYTRGDEVYTFQLSDDQITNVTEEYTENLLDIN